MNAVDYEEGRIPATLRAWCDRHADRVWKVAHGNGYATDSGRAYDLLLRPGWAVVPEFEHTIIESTVADTIAKARRAAPCDCDQCRAELQEAGR